MAIANLTYEYTYSGEGYLPLPINNNIDRDGYWYDYRPVNANNDTLEAEVKLYYWFEESPLFNSANTLTIEGTIPLISETLSGNTGTYHAGTVEHIGSGTNDITNTIESDAIFFGHMGAFAVPDDAFYWDRFYIEDGDTEWQYYQYHKHLPSFYVDYEQGRETTSGGGFIVPEDKQFGYQISLGVSSAGNPYQSRLARIHTPSIGGAHNSHNDVTLPTVGTKDYMSGGIIRGTSNKYHVFYITANSSQWQVLSRTYTAESTSFSTESDIGTYNLGDPVFSYDGTSSSDQSKWPLRASCGDVLENKIYFPVIMTNSSNSSNYDLEIWSFPSGTPLAQGDLTREVIETNFTEMPDAQCVTVGSNLYVAHTDVTNGGVSLHLYDGTSWADQGQILTNGSSEFVRVHGFRYNSADTKFYLLLSGTSTGGASTYEGDGVYSFLLDEPFLGYRHLDYNPTNNEFLLKSALTNGYIEYNINNGTLTKYTGQEPAGIATDRRIFDYAPSSASFFNKVEINIAAGVEEYFFDGINLRDGRKVLVGRAEGLPLNGSQRGNLLVSFLDSDNLNIGSNFVYGGAGDDYVTGVMQDINNDVWITGYTKSELVQKRDIKVHGFQRMLRDGSNEIKWVDLEKDAVGNYYLVGNHSGNFIVVAKFDFNFELVWQNKYDSGSTGADVAYGIALDSNDNVYFCGSTVNFGSGSTDALLVKVDSDGTFVFNYAYGTASAEVAKSVAIVNKSDVEYVVLPIESSTSTFFTILDTDGNIFETNNVSDLNVNRVRNNPTANNEGRFVFAGDDGANDAKFGMGEVDSSSRMIQWVREYAVSANSVARDIRLIGAPDGSGNGADYVIVGDEDTDGFVLQIQVDETVGSASYTIGKTWGRKLGSCNFNAVVVDDYTGTNKKIHIVGNTMADGAGMIDGLVVQYDDTGALQWQNTWGFMMSEDLVAVIEDITEENITMAGWTTSHKDLGGSNAVLFRVWKEGFGTGNYHISGNAMTKMFYQKSELTDSADSSLLSSVSAPTDSTASLTTSNTSATYESTPYSVDYYDGSYGPDGVFTFYIAKIDLDKVQDHFNDADHTYHYDLGTAYDYTDDIFTFYQVATVGDGSADDGNIFGYDIIEHSSNTIVCAGVTSGDITKTNTGDSGVYDYVLVKFDPATQKFSYFQAGSADDEEIYSLTELENAKVAFVGRTTGNLGANNIGGYDIFLGIHDMDANTSEYYSTGSGFNDTALNVHDLGNGSNTLAISYSTSGAIGNNVNQGSEDMGIIKFDYSTDIWFDAYQTGSETGELFTQNGHHSVLLDDGRIAIVGHSAGFFADDNVTSGLLDVIVGIVDTDTGEWKKYQIGTGSNDFGTAIFATGEKLCIAGHTEAAFEDGRHGLYMEFDASYGILGKSSST